MLEKYRYRINEKVGAHYHNKQRYVSGDEIELTKEEAERIKNKLTPLEEIPEIPGYVEPEVILKVVERADKGFDVINENTGIALNDVPLTKEEAEGVVGVILKTEEEDESPIVEDDKKTGRKRTKK